MVELCKYMAVLQTQELVLMMGFPGSGKTTYVKNCIPDTYTKLHGDILKTDAKKKKALKIALESKKFSMQTFAASRRSSVVTAMVF